MSERKENKMITKEVFCKAVRDAENVWRYCDDLNALFDKYNADGNIFQPDCVGTVISLLHYTFEEKDHDEWIEYFCYELDFGKEWREGLITENDGTDINLSTPENLYDYLMTL